MQISGIREAMKNEIKKYTIGEVANEIKQCFERPVFGILCASPRRDTVNPLSFMMMPDGRHGDLLLTETCFGYTLFVLQLPAYFKVYTRPKRHGRASAEDSILPSPR